MLTSYIDLLSERNLPDNNPDVTGAICQWYTTLDIEMKASMQIGVERARLITVLRHLRARVDDHLDDLQAQHSTLARLALKVKRCFRSVLKRENAVKISVFVMIGMLMAKSFQRRKP